MQSRIVTENASKVDTHESQGSIASRAVAFIDELTTEMSRKNICLRFTLRSDLFRRYLARKLH